jgi:aminoglycoside phosphotransferase (APT) family kinase protein
LDWELARYGRPTFDLSYFLAASTTPTFREKHLDELLNYYHIILEERLSIYGYKDTYSLETFKKEFKQEQCGQINEDH